jgi:hypothetical protein
MAQFSHADFGGMSQWSPGMSMVGDMFNKPLNAKLDALCSDLAAHLEGSPAIDGTRSAVDEVSFLSMSRSADWWPAGLGKPGAVGAQNSLRYAVFPDACRLVIDDHGAISVHETGSHRIFGVAQAQSSDQTLTFTSQDGLVRVADLPEGFRVTAPAAPGGTPTTRPVQKPDSDGAKHALNPLRRPRRLRRRLRGIFRAVRNDRSGAQCAGD